MTGKKLHILLADDNEDDVIATRRAWKKYAIDNYLQVVRDGEQCLDYLCRRGRYIERGSARRPHLLLLDLNMPKMNGLELLRIIRADDDLKRLPVIVLTTSKVEQDKEQSYALGIAAYIVKPAGFEKFAAAIKTINSFWQLVEV